MNLIKPIYSKLFFVLKREIRRNVKKTILIEETKREALSNLNLMINEIPRKEKIIVSLTTFGKRIHNVFIALESIAAQTMKADQIVLWLANQEFDLDSIPLTLKNMQERGLSIKFCKDLKSYNKLIPSLKAYPNDLIITVDDDAIYPHDMVELLYKTHLKYPDCICCHRAYKMKFDNSRKLSSYNNWELNTNEKEPSLFLFPTGVGGVLYFPNCFPNEVLNEEIFMNLSPKADDIWFKCMSLKNGIKCKVVGAYNSVEENYTPLDSSLIEPLSNYNINNKENDKQIKTIVDYFSIQPIFNEMLKTDIC